jgi:hypothetical protein
MCRQNQAGELKREDLETIVEEGVPERVRVNEDLIERIHCLQELSWCYLWTHPLAKS